MGKYLMIDGRGPLETPEAGRAYELAAELAREGQVVTVFLVQNAVLPARASARSKDLVALARAGVRVMADEFSLRERGIGSGRLIPEVQAAPLDVVVDHMAEGAKVLWS